MKSQTGCIKCGRLLRSEKRQRNTEEFIKDILQRFPDNEKINDYSKTEYVAMNKEIVVICKKNIIHGEYSQLAGDHSHGANCPKCKAETLSKLFSKTYAQFMKEVVEQGRQDEYDFSEAETGWVNSKVKIWLTCKKCTNRFQMMPQKFTGGQRCPCYRIYSKATTDIIRFLTQNNISYTPEYWEDELRNPKTNKVLRVDFMIHDKLGNNVCAVEFNGNQHTDPKHYYHFSSSYSLENFQELQERDRIKREWLDQKSIPYLDIWYFEQTKTIPILKAYLEKMGIL